MRSIRGPDPSSAPLLEVPAVPAPGDVRASVEPGASAKLRTSRPIVVELAQTPPTIHRLRQPIVSPHRESYRPNGKAMRQPRASAWPYQSARTTDRTILRSVPAPNRVAPSGARAES